MKNKIVATYNVTTECTIKDIKKTGDCTTINLVDNAGQRMYMTFFKGGHNSILDHKVEDKVLVSGKVKEMEFPGNDGSIKRSKKFEGQEMLPVRK